MTIAIEHGYRLLVFGASGAIGRTVVAQAMARGWSVTGVSRAPVEDPEPAIAWIRWDPATEEPEQAFAYQQPFDSVCWAQGANMGDSIATFEADRHRDLYEANVLSVLRSLAALVSLKLLSEGGARLVVISSLWQERARPDKLSYTVTKAAVGGLVRAASLDLGADGHLINAVMPGVLDTPMSRANLSAEQIESIANQTTLGRLPDLATVGETILFLCSTGNNAISGQSIAVDLGMNNAKRL